MSKLKLVKDHIYYLKPESWKLKYIETGVEGKQVFRITEHDDPEEDWWEYSTKDGSEIVKTKKESLIETVL